MPQYTVIGLYDDNGQTFAQMAEAENAWEAMAIVSRDALLGNSGDLQILGAIEGDVQLIPACGQSGCAAAAVDMVELLGTGTEKEG